MEATRSRFITVSEAARILRISRALAYTLIRSGELRAIKVGGARWRIEREVLERYIDDLYEESRRRSLWEQSEVASLSETSSFQNRNRSD